MGAAAEEMYTIQLHSLFEFLRRQRWGHAVRVLLTVSFEHA